MAQTETRAAKSEISRPAFVAMGKQQFEELTAMQKDLMATFQDASKKWIDRIQTETTLAADFSAQLKAARSIPEVAASYQEWIRRHMEMAAEDGKGVFVEAQKLADTGARLLSNGLRPNGNGNSSN